MTAPRDGWLRGVVKEVPSGDTVVVMAAVRPGQGIPPEKRLTLSSLMAPKLVCACLLCFFPDDSLNFLWIQNGSCPFSSVLRNRRRDRYFRYRTSLIVPL